MPGQKSQDGFDEHGNPLGRAFDLGGVDDERLRGEKILLYVAYLSQKTTGEVYEWQHAKQAVAERSLQMDITMAPNPGQCSLSDRMLAQYSQLWYVSDREVSLRQEQIELIANYVKSGNGLLIWADNEPYYADANLLAERIIGSRFSGNMMADRILVPGDRLRPGSFIEHPLTQGINQLYEGVTISTIAPAPHLTILAQSHDGQMCMACFERDKQRVALDTGFTKLYEGRFFRTAGTARYFRNIAFWLARGARGVEYIPFTPGRERIATIGPGATSEHYRFKLTEAATLAYLLHWEGAGTLGLVVQNPQGQIVHDSTSAKSPIRVTLPAGTPGDWVCWVRGVNVPRPDFPYVLTLARSAFDPSIRPTEVIRTSKPLKYLQSGKKPGITYEQPWSSQRPGCLIILLDQSSSMNDVFGNTQLGAGKKKSDVLATFLNNFLLELIRTNTFGSIVKPRADIAVLAYEGGTVRSAFSGAIANKPFVSLPELITNPLRVETRQRKEVDDAGQVIEIPVQFPVWVEPVIGTATPMCAALQKAAELADDWVLQHPNHYPPVVINITDGASTDGDPTVGGRELCQLGTDDGSALLFNCYLTTRPIPPVEFPSQASQIPADPENLGQTLFAMSSIIPEAALKQIAASTGQVLPRGARGLILNGDAGSIRQLFVFATVAATRPVDPNR